MDLYFQLSGYRQINIEISVAESINTVLYAADEGLPGKNFLQSMLIDSATNLLNINLLTLNNIAYATLMIQILVSSSSHLCSVCTNQMKHEALKELGPSFVLSVFKYVGITWSSDSCPGTHTSNGVGNET